MSVITTWTRNDCAHVSDNPKGWNLVPAKLKEKKHNFFIVFNFEEPEEEFFCASFFSLERAERFFQLKQFFGFSPVLYYVKCSCGGCLEQLPNNPKEFYFCGSLYPVNPVVGVGDDVEPKQ